MGKLLVNLKKTDNQQYFRQNLDMLIGRLRIPASIAVNVSDNDIAKAASINSSDHTDEELWKMWQAIENVNPKRNNTLIPDDSPLRRLFNNFSRKQVLIFDGIRYAAEMADIAYWRLFDLLQELSSLPESELTTRQIAIAMLDAWSIIDSTNRLRDLLRVAPGVSHNTWWKLFFRGTQDVDSLRNDVQHQKDNKKLLSLLVNAGQIWGYLSWAEIRNDRYTGDWYMMSPGAVYRGDRWNFAGPTLPSAPLPFGRIRLEAFNKEVYLGQIIKTVHRVIIDLTTSLQNGLVRASTDSPAEDRHGGDIIYSSRLEVSLSDGKTVVSIPDIGI